MYNIIVDDKEKIVLFLLFIKIYICRNKKELLFANGLIL